MDHFPVYYNLEASLLFQHGHNTLLWASRNYILFLFFPQSIQVCIHLYVATYLVASILRHFKVYQGRSNFYDVSRTAMQRYDSSRIRR